MGNSKSNSRLKQRSTTKENLTDECFSKLQAACSIIKDTNCSLTIASHKKHIYLVSQNPHIILSVAKYYHSSTQQPVQYGVSANKILFYVLLANGADVSVFAAQWPSIFIDYMLQNHPNYRFVSSSSTEYIIKDTFRSYQEKIYFIPNTINNDNDDIKQNEEEINEVPLPSGWIKDFDKQKGRICYKDTINNKTQWEYPTLQ